MVELLTAPTKNAIQKTLAAQLLSTANTGDPITFDDVDGIPNLPGVLVIRRVDVNGVPTPAFREYIEYSGTSGTTVLITTRNVDSSNAALTHPIGSIVEFIPDVTWAARIYAALLNIVNPSNLALDTTKVVSPSGITTLYNKMISGATLSSPTIHLGSDASGDIFFKKSTGELGRLPLGTTNQVLTANASLPYWGTSTIDTTGWIDKSAETWTRTGNFTFTITGDVTAQYTKGTKVRYKDGGSFEYGCIESSIYSNPSTTVTLVTNTDYAMAATTITEPAISYANNPIGFPHWFNYTPTFAGFSANPTVGLSKFTITGLICTVVHVESATGTSNSNSFNISLPTTAASGSSISWSGSGQVRDSGTISTTPGLLTISSGASFISLFKDWNTNFTNSGNKQLVFGQISYQI